MSRFLELKKFIRTDMRMSSFYQPVMIQQLLESDGQSSITQIAIALMSASREELAYYSDVTRNMVGKVLTGHGITDRKKDGNRIIGFDLVGFDDLTDDEVHELIAYCEVATADYFRRKK